MRGSESRSGCLLSWADEVEKEEQEEAVAQAQLLHQTQTPKPNPFGSARPREVVLQERGIDWRTIDQDLLQPPSSNRINRGRNEKLRIEIVLALATGPTRSPKQIPALPVTVSHCNQIPLRCPPKNGILKWVEKPCISPNIRRGELNRFEPEKENVFHKHRLQMDHQNAKGSDFKTYNKPSPNLSQQNSVSYGDHGRKCDNTGEGSTKTKPGQHKRRRRHNEASIKEGTSSFDERCHSRLPSVPTANEMKKMKRSDESQKSTAVAAGECGRARVGQITATKRTGFYQNCRKGKGSKQRTRKDESTRTANFVRALI